MSSLSVEAAMKRAYITLRKCEQAFGNIKVKGDEGKELCALHESILRSMNDLERVSKQEAHA